MPSSNEQKNALDKIFKKARVHFYKPIQIAEILHHHRVDGGLDLSDLESYRNVSKRWRDDISIRLIGRRSTSSQKFQDNLFDENAVPPRLLVALGEENKAGGGFVEAYVYRAMRLRLSAVRAAGDYIKNSNADTFSIKELTERFVRTPGLKRSIDKMYEIAVYALFTSIVRALRAKITVEIENQDSDILNDFGSFVKMVLGIDAHSPKLSFPAALYRVGVTNAADRGVDMWANFGPAIQVKHLSIKPETVEEIADDILADKIVIVCVDADKEAIETLLAQVGWGARIQGIVTLNDLDEWYRLSLGEKHRASLGLALLGDLAREFDAEFPSSEHIDPFMQERGYDRVQLPDGWIPK